MLKTQKETVEKYEELNQRMKSLMPNEKSNKELEKKIRDTTLGKEDHLLFLLHQTKDMASVMSIDGQRFILEWVLGFHD